MTLTIELSDDVAAQVERAAERRQMNVNNFATAAITKEACHGAEAGRLLIPAPPTPAWLQALIAEKPDSGKHFVENAGWWEGPETDEELLAALKEFTDGPRKRPLWEDLN